jgi:YidC/Oxa1 family membrane protein insertase
VDNRRLLLAVLLSAAVLVVWQIFLPSEPPPRPEPDRSTTEGPEARPQPPPPEDRAEGETAAEPSTEGELAEAAEVEPIAATSERSVTVETDDYRAVLTNRGAQLVSFELRGHTRAGGEGLDLVRHREGEPYPFALVGDDLEPLPLTEALFAVEESDAREGRTVTFRYRGPAGAAEKRFTFEPDGLFTAEVRVGRPDGWRLWLGPGIRNPTAEELDSRFERRNAVYRASAELERLDATKADQPVTLPGAGLGWAGLEDHYFLTAFIPREPIRGVTFVPLLMEPAAEQGGWRFEPVPPEGRMTAAQEELGRDWALLVEPEGDELSLAAYWGAKQLDRLAGLPYGLEEAVDLGWFGFLARWLLKGLIYIHDHWVGNSGWAIILLTFGIQLVLFPLTPKSYVSMRKMQQLNPKMQAIRERWRPKLKRKDGKPDIEAQRKMNEEVMALYKSEGVNPAGGCLPMLLQLPVLFAFYQLLSAAVELRNAPWLGWIHDLSAPDPFYALPIIMGATQFIQQKMTPAAGDPMQRRIFQLMPIFMTFLFLGFPSGLVLYWLTNNVLTIAQQGINNRLAGDKADAATPAETKVHAKPDKKSGPKKPGRAS